MTLQATRARHSLGKWIRGGVVTGMLGFCSFACSSPSSPSPTITLQSVPGFGATVSLRSGPGCVDPGCTFMNQVTLTGTLTGLPASQAIAARAALFAGSNECWQGSTSTTVSSSNPFTISVFTHTNRIPGVCGDPPAGSTTFERSPVTIDRVHLSVTGSGPIVEQDFNSGWRFTF